MYVCLIAFVFRRKSMENLLSQSIWQLRDYIRKTCQRVKVKVGIILHFRPNSYLQISLRWNVTCSPSLEAYASLGGHIILDIRIHPESKSHVIGTTNSSGLDRELLQIIKWKARRKKGTDENRQKRMKSCLWHQIDMADCTQTNVCFFSFSGAKITIQRK